MTFSNDGLVGFHYRFYGTFFYNKIGSIISIGDLPTTNIIEPFYIVYFLLYNFAITSRFLVKFLRY